MNLLRYIIGYFIGITLFVIIIPSFVCLLAYEFPYLKWDIPYFSSVRLIPSSPVFIVGLYFILWSNIFLLKRGKGGPTEGFGVEISPKTQKLVTTGVYKYSRNPMVFGAFSTYTSIALYMLSPTTLICIALFYYLAKCYIRKWEEPRLLKDFGNEYVEYKKQTAMIIPRFCNK